jgi:SAM-dependent methyltransferase
MRYFEAHEAIYARRLAAGATGWDNGAYDAPALRNQVERWLAASPAARPGARILELGCGTGALSCMLAERGFDVTGIDISASAISFARAAAVTRAARVQFEVAEACSWRVPAEAFDIVIDSHLLHCISPKNDRAKLLEQMARCLAKGGEVWTETMMFDEGLENTPSRYMDPGGTVWAKIENPTDCIDAVQRDGVWWMPMRFIAPTPAALIAEFLAAGLEAIEWSVSPPASRGEPADFRARFKRRHEG